MNRILAALALAASLGTPLSLDLLWPALGSLWDTPATPKEGFGWDPSGLKNSAPPPLDTEAGLGWDPSGLHNSPPPPDTEAGFGWDPNG